MSGLHNTMSDLWRNISSVVSFQKTVQGSLNNYSTLTPAYDSSIVERQEPTEEKREELKAMSATLKNDISPLMTEINSRLDLNIANTVTIGKASALAIEDRDIGPELERLKRTKPEGLSLKEINSKDSVQLLAGLFLLFDKAATLQTTLSEVMQSQNEVSAKKDLEPEIKSLGQKLDEHLNSASSTFNKIWVNLSISTQKVFIANMRGTRNLFSEYLESRDQLFPVSRDEA